MSHDAMVQKVADHLQKIKVSNISADLRGYSPRPDTISGFRPDITCDIMYYDMTDKCIIEVETKDSLGEAHTDNQWIAFANRVGWSKNLLCSFMVVVPDDCVEVARQKARQLGVKDTLLGDFMVMPISNFQ